MGVLALPEPGPDLVRNPLGLQGMARETQGHRRADAFLGCRPLSLAANLCFSLHALPVCLCANSLLASPVFISPCPSAYLSFLAPTPPTVQGTVRVELAWVRPETQLLQLPICFPSCDVVQPIPLSYMLLCQTQKLKEPMTLP